MGKAIIVQSEDKPIVRVAPERKAGIRVIDTTKLEKSSEQDDSGTPIMTLIEPSKAKIVYKTTVEPDDNESQKSTQGSEGEDKSSEDRTSPTEVELPEKFKGKTVADIVKSYKELESLTTRLAQKNMELESSSASKEKDTDDVELPDDIGEILIDDPKRAKELIKNAVKSVAEKQMKSVKEKEESGKMEDDVKGARKYVLENYPEYYSSTHSPTVDALAMSYPTGTYIDRYKKACADYTKLISDAKVEIKKEVQKEIEEVEQMKGVAVIPNSAPKKVAKKKYFRRSEINAMITTNPGIYAKNIDEIRLAIRENRVIED